MTKTRTIAAISLAGVFAIGMLFSSGFAAGHIPLTVEKYEIEWDEFEVKKVKMTVDEKIPTSDAFGYGVFLSSGDVLVTTTHAGVLDSEDQSDQWDPVWHNHVVALTGASATSPCGIANGGVSSLEVLDLTNESPGEAKIKKDKAEIKHAPMGDYVGQLSGTPLSIDEPANTIASFTLNPVNELGETSLAWTHVCVENVSTFNDPLPTMKIKGVPVP